jgi:serine/arginine repetitive matrix protein 1
MSGMGFYRGSTHEQNTHYKDKQKKLLKTMKFSKSVKNAKRRQVDMRKVKLDTVKPWIEAQITDALGFEDDIVIEMVFNQLEADQFPYPKTLQINMTGFLNAKKSRDLVGELWPMLVSACENGTGIPTVILEKKKRDIEDRDKTAMDLDGLMKEAREKNDLETHKNEMKRKNETTVKNEPINLDDDEEELCDFNPDSQDNPYSKSSKSSKAETKNEVKTEAVEVLDSEEEEEIRQYQMSQSRALQDMDKVDVKSEAEAAKFLEDLRNRAMGNKRGAEINAEKDAEKAAETKDARIEDSGRDSRRQDDKSSRDRSRSPMRRKERR